METGLILVDKGLEASCGPQLEFQKELIEGNDDGIVGSSSIRESEYMTPK
jgi:hypothetical protein